MIEKVEVFYKKKPWGETAEIDKGLSGNDRMEVQIMLPFSYIFRVALLFFWSEATGDPLALTKNLNKSFHSPHQSTFSGPRTRSKMQNE